MGVSKKTPEGQLVTQPKWQGNAITNDMAVLTKKGIVGLKINQAYAKATHSGGKLEYWFRSHERLHEWKNKTLNLNEFTIKLLIS